MIRDWLRSRRFAGGARAPPRSPLLSDSRACAGGAERASCAGRATWCRPTWPRRRGAAPTDPLAPRSGCRRRRRFLFLLFRRFAGGARAHETAAGREVPGLLGEHPDRHSTDTALVLPRVHLFCRTLARARGVPSARAAPAERP